MDIEDLILALEFAEKHAIESKCERMQGIIEDLLEYINNE